VNDEVVRQLWASVISQAICDIDVRGDRSSRVDALRWIGSNKTHPQSFIWICDMLDLDEDRIRMMVMTRAGRKQLTGKLFSRRALEYRKTTMEDEINAIKIQEALL
jgi:hypothetical protein